MHESHNGVVQEKRVRRISFDAFEVDLAAHELSKRGVRLRLQELTEHLNILAADQWSDAIAWLDRLPAVNIN